MWLPCYKPDKPPPRRVYGVIHLTVPGVNPSGFPLGVYPKLSRVLLVNASRGWFNYNVHTYVYWYYSDLLIALYADKVGVAYLSLYSLYVRDSRSEWIYLCAWSQTILELAQLSGHAYIQAIGSLCIAL